MFRSVGTVSRCRSCGAEIRWVQTITGKNVPIDAEPVDDGNITLERVLGQERAVVNGQPSLVGGPLYVSHFVTCPEAEEWRTWMRERGLEIDQ